MAPEPTTPPATDVTEPETPVTPEPPVKEYKKSTVKRAEQMLKRAGFNPGRVDGVLDPKAAKALKEFQQSVGMRNATGALDDDTLAHLENVSKRVKKHGSKRLGPGQRGKKVLEAEKRLRRLGYDTGRADGVYDRQTARAVKEFRKDETSLRNGSGIASSDVQKALEKESKAFNHDPYHSRVKPSAKRRALDERTAEAAARKNDDGTRGLGVGSKGAAVKYAQQHLRAAGYDPNRVDGTFDERTEGALRQFQRQRELPVTGRLDSKTWRALRKSTLEAKTGTSPRQTVGERSGAVRNTEKLLKKLGFNPGKVDGTYTEGTQRAVDKFRRKHDVDGVGKGVNAHTLKRLKEEVKEKENPFGKPVTMTAYTNGVPRKIQVVRVEGKLLSLPVAKAYTKMKNAAAKDGVDLDLVSGFRTMAEQQRLWNLYGPPRAARPGYSNHQNGIAIDLNAQWSGSWSNGVGEVYNWLARNAGKYGFKRIPLEAWHWEYRP